MANIPLTEKRLLELLDPLLAENRLLTEKRLLELLEPRFKSIDDKFKSIDDKLISIDIRLHGVEGFQRHESEAIVFELRLVLEKYLRKEYPIYTVKTFPMKSINDPYTDERLTEFDAAYIIQPYTHNSGNLNTRLREKNIKYRTLKKQPMNGDNIFILAEAKHYIDVDKIKLKLWQFDKLMNLFSLAKRIHATKNMEKRKEFGVNPKFLSTIQYNQIIAHIHDYRLFFGAAYWQKGLLLRFRDDIEERNRLYNQFVKASGDEKIRVYRKLINVEKRWYQPENLPNHPKLSDDEIARLKDLPGAMKYIDIIQPSGERYSVFRPNEPVGITSISLQGGLLSK